MFYVYEILDKKGNLLYIGKGKDEGKYSRLEYYKYISKDRYIDRKLRKIKEFDINIIQEFDDEQKALEMEIKQIKERNPLCNLTEGGEGISGYKHTQESKIRMSKNRDIQISLTNLQKAKESNTGKRKLDRFETRHIERTINKYGWNKGANMLGVSYTTVKTYCNEKQITPVPTLKADISRKNLHKASKSRWKNKKKQ